MKGIEFKTEFSYVYIGFMVDSVHDIMKEAIRLVSGPLLKQASGTLAQSFVTEVDSSGEYGSVSNTAPYADIWENQGIDYKKIGKNGKREVIKIVKRGAISGRSSFGTIYRSLNYNKTKAKKPVHFLWEATKNEMAGQRGQNRMDTLAYEVAYVAARKYVDSLIDKGTKEGFDVTELWELL